jgi:hypothetical protein
MSRVVAVGTWTRSAVVPGVPVDSTDQTRGPVAAAVHPAWVEVEAPVAVAVFVVVGAADSDHRLRGINGT